MHRVAVLSDIHANLPALEAVLADVEAAAPETIVLMGDYLWGPLPAETAPLVAGLLARPDTIAIRGNCDRELGAAAGSSPRLANDWIAAVNDWCTTRLSAEQIALVRDLPEQATLPVAGLGDIRVVHGSPRSDEDGIVDTTSPARLDSLCTGVTEPVLLAGHTHLQFRIEHGGRTYVNPGSVGLPFADEPATAYWALIDAGGIELRRTGYDADAACERTAGAGCPHDFTGAIRSPPPPAAARQMWP